ncbi:MAG: translation initiation factor IF-2 N-terminal domain-containing protein [Candidatus Gastranaerophilaceae bacterium]
MTVGELSEKINKASAEIVKFLMMQGILATVNQVIDVPTAKKVCENFEIEVQEEDLEAFIEEEMQKEEEAKELAAIDPKLLKRRAPVISIMGTLTMVKQHFLIQSAHSNTKLYQLKLVA